MCQIDSCCCPVVSVIIRSLISVEDPEREVSYQIEVKVAPVSVRHCLRRVEHVIDRVNPHMTGVIQEIQKQIFWPRREQLFKVGGREIIREGEVTVETDVIYLSTRQMNSCEGFEVIAGIKVFESFFYLRSGRCNIP